MRKPSFIHRIRLTTAITALVISSVVLSIAGTAGAIYISLTASSLDLVHEQQRSGLKIAASTLDNGLEGTKVVWSETDEILDVVTRILFSGFGGDALADEIQRLTGQAAAIFSFDPATQIFTAEMTSEKLADGKRAPMAAFTKSDPGFADVMANKSYFGTIALPSGEYFSAYLPVRSPKGEIVGLVYMGYAKAKMEALLFDTLRLLAMVGGIALVVLGIVGFIASRALTSPVPRLAAIMQGISEGTYDLDVPFTRNSNELGNMARAVEIFRQNGERITEMTEAERTASIARSAERKTMLHSLQAAFGSVVDAAAEGNFSERVLTQFPDPELNKLAGSVNALVERVEHGLDETGRVLTALANADLSVRMEGDYQGSFKTLQSNANRVAETLSSIVGRLRTTSGMLKSATDEILAGANDLSARTGRQVATIEDTTRALGKLTDTVAQNAVAAGDASGKARSVSESAARGGEVMHKATEAMERITKSSGQISTIAALIDDIAFQTNLLALNASVEAARAGDAGRGFSVVATEVRRLAQSAAEASSEVKALIEQSSSEVKTGSGLVSMAADQLRDIVRAIDENNELVGAIALASQDQASGLSQISSAMAELGEITQHNAALAEQTNAAIEQTQSQAAELDLMVDVFQTERRGIDSRDVKLAS